MMKKIVCFAAASALMAMGSAFAQGTADKDRDLRKDNRDIREDRKDLRQDRKDVREDRRDIRQDKAELRQDQRELRREVKEGDKAGAAAERREISRDKIGRASCRERV